MTQTDKPFQLIHETNATILVLLPELNNVQWGDIDAIGTEVLNSISVQESPNIIVDLTELNYMGSAMVALIVRVWKAAQAKNGKIAVACPHDGVKEVLKLASLDKVWSITESRDEAKHALGIKGAVPGGSSMAATGGSGSSTNAGWIVAFILLIACIGLGLFAFNPGLFGVKPQEVAEQGEEDSEAESEESEEAEESTTESEAPAEAEKAETPEFSTESPATEKPAATDRPTESSDTPKEKPAEPAEKKPEAAPADEKPSESKPAETEQPTNADKPEAATPTSENPFAPK